MKTICVPKNTAAAKRLDYDECLENDLIGVDLDEDVFYELLNQGFFKKVNNIAGSMIDNYEDDGIVDCGILKEILSSDLFKENVYGTKNNHVIAEIKSLFEEALKRDTGVYFYF